MRLVAYRDLRIQLNMDDEENVRLFNVLDSYPSVRARNKEIRDVLYAGFCRTADSSGGSNCRTDKSPAGQNADTDSLAAIITAMQKELRSLKEAVGQKTAGTAAPHQETAAPEMYHREPAAGQAPHQETAAQETSHQDMMQTKAADEPDSIPDDILEFLSGL